jgi:hypothetical protein
MNGFVQRKDRNIQEGFGHQQVSKFQLFTDDWLQNHAIKKGNKVYGKYRENKKKEKDFLKRLKTLSVIRISDRSKPSRFSGAKIKKVLKTQQAFRIFNVYFYRTTKVHLGLNKKPEICENSRLDLVCIK